MRTLRGELNGAHGHRYELDTPVAIHPRIQPSRIVTLHDNLPVVIHES